MATEAAAPAPAFDPAWAGPGVLTDGWAWAALGLLLVLLAARAWVVESGRAALGRTPVKITVLTAACAVVAVLLTGLVTANGGAYLVYLVAHPKEAQALEDAAKASAEAAAAAASAATDPPDPVAPPEPPPTTPPPTAAAPPTTSAAPPPPTTTRPRVTRARPTTRTAPRPPAPVTSAPPAPTASTSTKARGDAAKQTSTSAAPASKARDD